MLDGRKKGEPVEGFRQTCDEVKPGNLEMISAAAFEAEMIGARLHLSGPGRTMFQ